MVEMSESSNLTLTDKITTDFSGPSVVTGGVDHIADNIQFAEGSSREHYTLCRCGASENKPFCMVCI
jgi:hypothetical protein